MCQAARQRSLVVPFNVGACQNHCSGRSGDRLLAFPTYDLYNMIQTNCHTGDSATLLPAPEGLGLRKVSIDTSLAKRQHGKVFWVSGL